MGHDQRLGGGVMIGITDIAAIEDGEGAAWITVVDCHI